MADASSPALWQQELAQAIGDIRSLLEFLDIDPAGQPLVDLAPGDFPLRVPRYYAGLMETGNADDPLLRQILPVRLERLSQSGFVPDPTGDLEALAVPGVLKKYQGRALWLVTGACAVHCRYCFRRHFPYGEQALTPSRQSAALHWLHGQPDIHELILSGGDPLSLSDRRLEHLLEAIAQIPHLRRLRIHTRLPVVLPSRLNTALLEALTRCPLPVVMVLHSNHPAELTESLRRALQPLRQRGITLFNQAVLLRGVNDDVATQIALQEGLFAIGVLPYYLHSLDQALGTGHFQVEESRAQALYQAMRLALPGYLLPRLVREDRACGYKVPL